jgi:hypothetical protein
VLFAAEKIHRVLKISNTIADPAEALQYRRRNSFLM